MRFKARRALAGLAKFIAPGYSTCGRCDMSWKFVQGHTVYYKTNRGLFAICEECWNETTPAERLVFYVELWNQWPREDHHVSELAHIRLEILGPESASEFPEPDTEGAMIRAELTRHPLPVREAFEWIYRQATGSVQHADSVAALLSHYRTVTSALEHDGEVCQHCGRPYDSVHHVPDELWAMIARGAVVAGGYRLLCRDCIDTIGAERRPRARSGAPRRTRGARMMALLWVAMIVWGALAVALMASGLVYWIERVAAFLKAGRIGG